VPISTHFDPFIPASSTFVRLGSAIGQRHRAAPTGRANKTRERALPDGTPTRRRRLQQRARVVDGRLGWHNARMSSVAATAVRYAYSGSASRSSGPKHRKVRPADAVDGVDLVLRSGTLTALLGPNGSGKSTLLRLIAGLDRPTSGEITVADAVAGSREAARAIGVVFQSPSLDPRLTVRENLRAHAVLHAVGRVDCDAAIATRLEEATLAEHADRLVRTLSGGLARRVDLVRALLPRPRVLLLDEPTVGLDPAARGAFLDLVVQASRRDGVTVLLTTHLVDEAERADRVVLMHRGRVVVDGSPNELRSQLGRRVISVHQVERPGLADRARWRRRNGAWTIEPDDDAETERLVVDLMSQTAPVTIAPPTLEDLFVRLTGEDLAAASVSTEEAR